MCLSLVRSKSKSCTMFSHAKTLIISAASEVAVILFTGGRGSTHPPVGRPGEGGWADPRGCRSPRMHTPPRYVNKRAVHILLECIPVLVLHYFNLKSINFYRPCNVFTPVCQSFCHTPPPEQTPPWQTPPPPGQTLPWADTPWADFPPPAQCMLGYGQQAGGTHLTGMQSCRQNIL